MNILWEITSSSLSEQADIAIPSETDALDWTTDAVTALEAAIGWGDSAAEMLNRLGRASIDVRESGLAVRDYGSHGFADAWWVMWISGLPLQRLGGVEAVLAGWPGALAEDQSVGERAIAFTMLAHTPDLVEHAVYLSAFDFLRPVLAQGVEPRFDPAHLEESFQLLTQGVPQSEWPEHLQPLAWPSAGSGDAPPTYPHLGKGPTDEELRNGPLPETDPELNATFKAEESDDDDELLGPLIVSHPERGVLWESPDWMREPDARVLAERRRWRFWVDA
jgi:hypothetical protein